MIIIYTVSRECEVPCMPIDLKTNRRNFLPIPGPLNGIFPFVMMWIPLPLESIQCNLEQYS